MKAKLSMHVTKILKTQKSNPVKMMKQSYDNREFYSNFCNSLFQELQTHVDVKVKELKQNICSKLKVSDSSDN